MLRLQNRCPEQTGILPSHVLHRTISGGVPRLQVVSIYKIWIFCVKVCKSCAPGRFTSGKRHGLIAPSILVRVTRTCLQRHSAFRFDATAPPYLRGPGAYDNDLDIFLRVKQQESGNEQETDFDCKHGLDDGRLW